MHFSELPLTREILGSSAKGETLAQILEQIAPTFSHVASIEGLPFSGRLLLLELFADAHSLERPMSAADVGEGLVTAVDFAGIYHHPQPSQSYLFNRSRGWQIHYLWVSGRPAALALATWC